MKFQMLATLMLGLTLTTACSTEPERPNPPEGYFATHVDEDGTEQFQYTIDLPDAPSRRGNGRPGNAAGHVAGGSSRGLSGGVSVGSGGRSGKPTQGSSSGSQRFQHVNDQLERELERELAKSGFCPHGHRETERVVEPPTVYVRGECIKKSDGDSTL